MDERLARLATEGDGLLIAEHCLAAGVSRAALRWAVASGAMVRLAPGALAPVEVWERADPRRRHLLLLRAAMARCPGAVAAGPSAAVVWGLPSPDSPPETPVLLRPRSSPRPERGGRSTTTTTRRAWLEENEIDHAGGIRVTSPARTFVDVSRAVSFPWALTVADAVRRMGVPVEELVAAAERRPTAPGHARSLRAARSSENLVESALESLARGVQIELGLPAPRVQAWIGRDRPEFRVDMLVDQYRTVVEADGRLKYEGPSSRAGQAWADKRRRDRLLELGYDCHRFVMADLARAERWGRSLLVTFARSCIRLGRPVPAFPYPWA